MRNWRYIRNQIDPNTKGRKRTNRRFTTWTWAFDSDVKILDTLLLRSPSCNLGGNLRGKWRALARALEALTTTRCPSQSTTLTVGDRNDGVVERSVNVGNPIRHVFSNLLSHTLCGCIRCLSHMIFSST
jgi:hypothetical protein